MNPERYQRPTDVVCDRCGREPGRIRGTIPYCWICMHECTFTRCELRAKGDAPP
jgi:hypothetical protein